MSYLGSSRNAHGPCARDLRSGSGSASRGDLMSRATLGVPLHRPRLMARIARRCPAFPLRDQGRQPLISPRAVGLLTRSPLGHCYRGASHDSSQIVERGFNFPHRHCRLSPIKACPLVARLAAGFEDVGDSNRNRHSSYLSDPRRRSPRRPLQSPSNPPALPDQTSAGSS